MVLKKYSRHFQNENTKHKNRKGNLVLFTGYFYSISTGSNEYCKNLQEGKMGLKIRRLYQEK